MTTDQSSKVNVNTEKKQSSLSLKKSVHRNNSPNYYLKLDNETIRARIDGDPLTAKDIWLDALTCRDDWLFTTPNIAKRHNIDPKKAQRLLTRLVNAGVAERCTITDPATGQFMIHHYIFYESPVDKKCPVDKTEQHTENKDKTPKKSSGQNLSTVSIKNKHKELTTSSPPPPPLSPKTDLPDIIKTELENSEIEVKLVVECQERFKDTEYTLEAIRMAKTKEHHSRYFRFLALKKCNSVLRRIAEARAETELIRKNREILNRARIEQDEAKLMSTLTITDFAEGAAMMRAALRKK